AAPPAAARPGRLAVDGDAGQVVAAARAAAAAAAVDDDRAAARVERDPPAVAAVEAQALHAAAADGGGGADADDDVAGRAPTGARSLAVTATLALADAGSSVTRPGEATATRLMRPAGARSLPWPTTEIGPPTSERAVRSATLSPATAATLMPAGRGERNPNDV